MNKIIRELQAVMDLRAIDKMNMASGKLRDYPFIVGVESNLVKLIFSVKKDTLPDVTELKVLVKQAKGILNVKTRGAHVEFYIKIAFTAKKTANNILNSLEEAVEFFSMNNYVPCCEATGEITSTEACMVGGIPQILSERAYLEASSNLAIEEQKSAQMGENVLGGIVGALLGSILGVVVIVVIAQLGYVSAISGIIMSVVTVKGYSLLSGKFTKKGIVISLIVILLMVYVGNNLDGAINIAKIYDVNIFDAFLNVRVVVVGTDLWGIYIENIAKLYLFTALGAILTMIQAVKDRQNRHVSYKI